MVIIIIAWVKALYIIASNVAFTEENCLSPTLTTFLSAICNSEKSNVPVYPICLTIV